MTLTIERCVDANAWKRLGRDANADHPEYQQENVFWPVHETPVNGGLDLSIVASADGREVGRLQRRREHVLEVSVAPDARRRGIGRALVEYARRDARAQGLKQLVAWEIDEANNAEALGFFDAVGFKRIPQYSMLADLSEPIPPATEEQADRLRADGFRARLLDGQTPADLQLTIDLQARYFPGFPEFVSVEEMVKTMFANGQMAMVLDKGGAVAGFIIGGVNTGMSNRRCVRREGYGLLLSIATVEEFRRMGVASTIMVEFVRHLKRQGMRYMLYGGSGPEGRPSRHVAQSVGAVREVRHFFVTRET